MAFLSIQLSAYESILVSLFLVLSISDLTLDPVGEFSNDNSEKQLTLWNSLATFIYTHDTFETGTGPLVVGVKIGYVTHVVAIEPNVWSCF